MRKALGALVAALLLLPALAVMAHESEDYRDDFGDGDYFGNDGSLDFAGPWIEFGDTGGSGGGKIHIGDENCSGNECLHIEGPGGLLGLILSPYRIERAADLSMFESVDLQYKVRIFPQGLTTATLHVEVLDGSTWREVASHNLAQSTSQPMEIDVSEFADEDFALRFVVGGLLNLTYVGFATIDNLVLTGNLEAGPTTTSTTSTTSTSTSTTTTTTTPGGQQTTTTTRATTTSNPGTSTTSTTGAGPTTTQDDPGGGDQETGATSTTIHGTTTSSTGDGQGIAAPGLPPGSGLHEAGVGLIADYETGMMGDLSMHEVEVLGAELTADFSMAVEAFEATRLWIGALALLMATAVVSGMDRRRSRKADAIPVV